MNTITDDLRSKSVFELSDEELSERLRPAYEAVRQKAIIKN